MPTYGDYRARIFNDFYDEIIRLFKILPLAESMRRDILSGLGSPGDFRKDVNHCQLCERLRWVVAKLITIYPDKKIYFDSLLANMRCKDD